MVYYENSKGEVIGRLYEVSGGFAAELGRRAQKNTFGFIATKGVKLKTQRQAERYLLENGCVAAASA